MDSRSTTLDSFSAALNDAVRKEVQQAAETALEHAKQELDRRIPEIVAGFALNISQRIAVERFGEDIRIHVTMSERAP